MPHPNPRLSPVLWAGLLVAFAMAIVGPIFGLYRYADGSIFTYGVAAGEGWAFHFRNIAHRAVIYGLAQMPAEAVGRLTGSLSAASLTYGLLFFALPLVSLALTAVLDRTPGRIVAAGASVSTIVVLPLVFGFPTEMWASHAIVWPVMALATRRLSPLPLILGQTLLCLTHEAGVIFAGLVVVAGLVVAPTLKRAAGLAVSFAIGLLVWFAVRSAVTPDPYLAEVLTRNAWNLFEINRLFVPITVLGLIALVGVPLGARALQPRLGDQAPLVVGAVLGGVFALWWLAFDRSLHAETRYSMRTALLGLTPLVILLTAAAVRVGPVMLASQLSSAFTRRTVGVMLGLAALIHAVEAAKFIRAWTTYETALAALALSDAADPGLGDPQFISTDRLDRSTDAVSWNSTTPYLSVLLAGPAGPKRLVVDPRTGYFWLPCALARRHAATPSTVPAPGTALIARYSCLHRPDR